MQTSVKTVQMSGAEVLYDMWSAMTKSITVPVALHLDHCPDRGVISQCLRIGWNSVLFDASALTCRGEHPPVHRGGGRGAGRTARSSRARSRASSGSRTRPRTPTSEAQSLETAVEFIRATGVDVFAPAIGNAHGMYRAAPTLDSQRVTDIVEATGIPVALHGGTGMTPEQFTDLIARGCAKVNISTALKISFMQSGYDYMTEHPGKYDPPALFVHQRQPSRQMAEQHIALLGSDGKAW